jgi:DNA-binding LytR/AlgR family response regulator
VTVRILVAEDEAPQRRELCALLQRWWPDADIVAECADGLSALEALETLRPQVAFLDIRMPGVDGLEVARAASGRAHVVFTTAYEEYALRAFDHGAIDYLLKPISQERVRETIHRLRERIVAGSPADVDSLVARLKQQLDRAGRRSTLRWITASVADTVRMLPIEDILFFQSQDKYTRVATADAEAHIRTPLKELLAALDPDEFWQVHRSVIVRASAIDVVRRDAFGKLELTLKSRNDVLPVSQAFQHRFRGM